MALEPVSDPKAFFIDKPFREFPVVTYDYAPDQRQVELVVIRYETGFAHNQTFARYRFCGVKECTQTHIYRSSDPVKPPTQIQSADLRPGRIAVFNCDPPAGRIEVRFTSLSFEARICRVTKDARGNWQYVDIGTNKTVTPETPFDPMPPCPEVE
jgi:hypothetical protein